MNHSQVLKNSYNLALNLIDTTLTDTQISYIQAIAENVASQKGVYTVLITLLTHKIIDPNQDIRLHQQNMTNGFSGRTIDTKYITPTLRELSLPCMAESGWLTRSLEQPYPYNLNYQGKISNTKIKSAFLQIIDDVQQNLQLSEPVLVYLLYCVYQKIQRDTIIINKSITPELYTIESIIEFLTNCFNFNYKEFGGSKLPVIAFHCIFRQLIAELKRYEHCTLKPLGSHTASDRTSKTAGDIEIFRNGVLFEAIEIKLNKPIDANLIRIAQQKIYQYNPERYCTFSTADIIEQEVVYNLIDEIRIQHGCQVIVNGIIPTLKYYLRLIISLEKFMNVFLISVENDTELKSIHKQTINQLLNIIFE